MRGDEAARRGVWTISDLARVPGEDSSLKLATAGEFSRRENGRVKAFQFATLADDEAFFPDYALTPVAREDTLDAQPQLRAS